MSEATATHTHTQPRTRRICIVAATQHTTDTQHDTQPTTRESRPVRSPRTLLLLVYLLLSLCVLPAVVAADSLTVDPNPALHQSASATGLSDVPAAAPADLPAAVVSSPSSVDPAAPESLGPSSLPLPSPAPPSSLEEGVSSSATTLAHGEVKAAPDDQRRESHARDATATNSDGTASHSVPPAMPAVEESAQISVAVDRAALDLPASPTDVLPTSLPSPAELAPSTEPAAAATADSVSLVSGRDSLVTDAPAALTPATVSADTSAEAAVVATDVSVTVAPADTLASSSSINVSVRVLPVPVAQIVVNDSVGLNATLAALLANASAAAVPVIVVVPAPVVPSVTVTPPVLLTEPAVDSELPRLDAYKQTVLDLVAEKEGKKKTKKVEAEGAAATTLAGAAATTAATADPAAAVAAAISVPSPASVPSQPPSDPGAAVAVSLDPPSPPASAPPPASIPRGPESGESDHDRDRFNYAAFDAGAKMLATSPGMKKANSILISDDDRYLMVPCGADHKHFVIQLSEDIMIDTIEIANLEHYASSIKDFQIMGSASHPTTQWTLLGTYVALDSTQKQVFTLPNKQWVRFIKLIWNTHYGDEYYCTLTYLRVYGTTMLETFHQEMQQSEVDVQEITQTIMQAKPSKNTKTEADEATPGQPAALPAVRHAVPDGAPTIEVEVSDQLPTPVAPSDPVLAAPVEVVEPTTASILANPAAAVSEQTRTGESITAVPQSATEMAVASTVAEVAPAETDSSNLSSSNASLSPVAPNPTPTDSDSTLPRPSDDSAPPSLVSPTVLSALLHDAAIVDTVADVLTAAAAAEANDMSATTHANDTQQQQATGDTTRTTEQASNGTEDSVTAPATVEQLSPAPTVLTAPTDSSQPSVESSSTGPSASSSVLVAELVPTMPAVTVPAAPIAVAPAALIPDPPAVATSSVPPVLSRDAPFPSLPSLRSGSDRGSSGSSSVSGQQSIFKSLTNRIKQLEIEQAMIHNYVSDLADQYNRDMANIRARMEAMAHEQQANRERTEMQWRDGWAALNSTSEAMSADNQRVLQSVKAQLDRAQETTETVELVIHTQLWLSAMLFAIYFLGRWLLSLARYARKSLMRLCCWLRRRKRMTRHVHSKSSPSLMLTDEQFAELQSEADGSNAIGLSKRQQRRNTAQHNRGPQRDHSRTMSMQPAQRPRMHTEPVMTEPFDPRATAASVALAGPAVPPHSLASTLSPSHLVSLNPRRAHALAADPLLTASVSPPLSLSPRPRLGLESPPALGSGTSSPSPSASASASASSPCSRSPPCVHRSSLIPACVEEESDPAVSAPPSQRASPAPLPTLPSSLSEFAPYLCPDGSPPPSHPTESTPRRFSLGLLPRWITSPSSRRPEVTSADAAASALSPSAAASSALVSAVAASSVCSQSPASRDPIVSPLSPRRSLLVSLVHSGLHLLSGREEPALAVDTDAASAASPLQSPGTAVEPSETVATHATAAAAAACAAAPHPSSRVLSPSRSLSSSTPPRSTPIRPLTHAPRSILRNHSDGRSSRAHTADSSDSHTQSNETVSFATQAIRPMSAHGEDEVDTEGEDEEPEEQGENCKTSRQAEEEEEAASDKTLSLRDKQHNEPAGLAPLNA